MMDQRFDRLMTMAQAVEITQRLGQPATQAACAQRANAAVDAPDQAVTRVTAVVAFNFQVTPGGGVQDQGVADGITANTGNMAAGRALRGFNIIDQCAGGSDGMWFVTAAIAIQTGDTKELLQSPTGTDAVEYPIRACGQRCAAADQGRISIIRQQDLAGGKASQFGVQFDRVG